MSLIPALKTERLTLRPPVLADFETYAGVLTSPRSVHMDGPYSRREAWLDFLAGVGQWGILGFGTWSMAERDTDLCVGAIALNRPPHFPENELGWFVAADAEGRGLATEAATAVRDWAWSNLGWKTMVSYIGPKNTASIRVAERLGAVRDDTAPVPANDNCVVFRYIAPEADT